MTIIISLILNSLLIGVIIYFSVKLALKKVVGIMEGYAKKDNIPLGFYLTKEELWNIIVKDPKKYGLSYPIDEGSAEFKAVLEKLKNID